jgi:Tfp pilus assembly protein PilE
LKGNKFTIIELLIVVSIIAILLPSLSRARDKAKIAICGSQMSQIGTPFYAYLIQNEGYVPVNHSLGNGGERTWDDHLSG